MISMTYSLSIYEFSKAFDADFFQIPGTIIRRRENGSMAHSVSYSLASVVAAIQLDD